jgi:hypothetical protein
VARAGADVSLFLGAFLGIAAQTFLAIVVIFHVLPWFGLELLDTAPAKRQEFSLVRSTHV